MSGPPGGREERLVEAPPPHDQQVSSRKALTVRHVVKHGRGRNKALRLAPPRHRIIVAVDIENSTARTNPAKADLRHLMYTTLEKSLVVSGIYQDHRDSFVDRGDGILVLIHPVDEVPTTVLLSSVFPTLGELLSACADAHLRLRAVLHAGEVHYDGRGCFGEALDIAFYLLSAPEVKHRFREIAAPLLLVVSHYIHQSFVRHGYDGINEREFVPDVHVQVAGQQHLGWIQVPTATTNGH